MPWDTIPLLKRRDQLPWDTMNSTKVIPTNGKVLLAGLFFSAELPNTNPGYGQHYRDRLRCQSLARKGFQLETMDDKHQQDDCETDHNHYNVNCSVPSAVVNELVKRHGSNYIELYDLIIVDYNFAPGSEYQRTWNAFISKTIPLMYSTRLLKSGGCILLPGWREVGKTLQTNFSFFKNKFKIVNVSNNVLHLLF